MVGMTEQLRLNLGLAVVVVLLVALLVVAALEGRK